MTNRFPRRALACTLLATTCLASPAVAQTVTSPTFRQVDANGVDLVQGDLVTSFTEGSIGSGEGELKLLRRLGSGSSGGNSPWDNILLQYIPGNGTFVDFGVRHDKFPGAETRGATLSGGGASYQYHLADGTIVAFVNGDPDYSSDSTNLCRDGSTDMCSLYPSSITSPDGGTITFDYEYWSHCFTQTPPGQPRSPDDPVHCDYVPRLKSVANSDGYKIVFGYSDARTGGLNNPPASWFQRSGASFFNNVYSTTTPQASVSYAYPASGVTDITDMAGNVWRVTNSSALVAIRRPGASADTTSYALSNGLVTSATVEGVTTSYARSVSGSTATMTVTDALNHASVVTSDLNVGRPTSVTDPLNRTTSFQYDANGRLTRTTLPEGNYTQLTYDARGNVTEARQVAKAASGQADLVTTASYDLSCANPLTCNQPNSTTDARGNTTDYTYDPTHGGVLTVTQPAAPNGIRPRTRTSYALTNGVYRLTGISACQTTASCTGTSDETKVAAAYDANGNVASVTRSDGTGALSAMTAMTYTVFGDLETVDGPLAGTADTAKLRYDNARRLVGSNDPDPDGSGPLKMRAVRLTRRADGAVTKQELGTVSDLSNSAWAAFAPAQAVDVGYDSNARPVTSKLSAGGTAYSLTQTSYDALGRSDCTAVRMNIAAYGALPASACTLGTQGSDGPDRISKTVYDAAGEVTQLKTAVGTADEAIERTLVYTPNGTVGSLIDGENNRTDTYHDGFDRLGAVFYPSNSKGSGASNPNDTEQFAYDANGNVTAYRNRGGALFNFAYDNLDRMTLKDRPGSEPDVSYAYDLLGRMTSASQTGNALTFTYDALSRETGESGPLASINQSFDLAGRRTHLGTSGGYSLNYQRLVTGEMSVMLDGNNSALVTFGYDDLRRRGNAWRTYGTSAGYGYDSISRLASITQIFTNSVDNVNSTFAYNPAAGITSVTRSNDAYAFTGSVSGTTNSVSNGLNQVTSAGAASLTYDANGNLTSDGTRTYAYDSENRLVSSTSGGVTTSLSYDPLGRLYEVSSPSGVRRFLYAPGESGLPEAIGEYDGANVGRHFFAFGPGTDEPMFWWDMTGTAALRTLHPDERGSIVAVGDGTGNPYAINRYDEYGAPQGGSVTGHFGFTGQLWLPEVGKYYYKNRMYDPDGGRFMASEHELQPQ